ncbi:WavE lipopolysaccharide synthesis family protein [Vibrio sp. SCSIO 43136]|uniref:WavE lipopolysaccharide synthesis family protein n=1 Tax=Vibrio sp. SCSIO 43136 TaxID=2819101 RepID=UPI00207539F4|nr:WavE lipopolysaccharide synthesis family protein [Vibrio sp. SCSIO 43136]USD65161.1 hypothetical protein J4N39_14100 [Vibrio sp. SCSIO 43136]
MKSRRMSINLENITVVIQGPTGVMDGRDIASDATVRACQSVRQWLPGAKIIVSTWEGQPVENLDYDQLVLSSDPGAVFSGYNDDGSVRMDSHNRQTVSTLAGLQAVQTQYAVKLRSDSELQSAQFVALQNQYQTQSPAIKLKERMVMSSRFFKSYHQSLPVLYHISDFFQFGTTEDLINFWCGYSFESFESKPEQYGVQATPESANTIHTEQALGLRWLSHIGYDPKPLAHRLDVTNSEFQRWLKFTATELVILDLEDIELTLPQRLLASRFDLKELCGLEWQYLYRKNLGSMNLNLAVKYWLKIGLARKVRYR